MVEKATFHGVYHYYENVNGKEKKVEKSFTDRKKYDEFMKKHPLPSFTSIFSLGLLPSPKPKALVSKKKSSIKISKIPAKKKR
jgi:hypothetical protein